jgi:hypothetical protein
MHPAVAQYPLGQAIGTSFPDAWLGSQASFADLDYDAIDPKPTLSGHMVDCILVKQTGATAIAPGSVVKWSVAGTEVAAVAGANEVPAGVVDPYRTTSVAQGEAFWLITRGPALVLSSAAIAANAPVRTAASGQTVTTDYSTEQASVGVQITAATDAAQLRRTFVDCRVL